MKNWNELFAFMQHNFTTKLEKHLYYHNWEHTLYVVSMTEYIAKKENIKPIEILLLKTASLFHDAGYLHNVNMGHEKESVTIARNILPEYNYNSLEINKICDMIMATKIPHVPKNIFEKIIADADLEYLGTSNFKPFGNLLFKELQYYQPELDETKWNAIQIDFLEKHKYHTQFCIENREETKQYNLENLRKNTNS